MRAHISFTAFFNRRIYVTLAGFKFNSADDFYNSVLTFYESKFKGETAVYINRKEASEYPIMSFGLDFLYPLLDRHLIGISTAMNSGNNPKLGIYATYNFLF